MDFDKIKTIRTYVKKIIKFKKLDIYTKMTKDEFSNEMAKIFPNFKKEYSEVFKIVTHNEELGILNLMFKKLDEIEIEYNERIGETSYLRPIIYEVRNLLSKTGKIKKDELIEFIEKNNIEFVEKYPILVDRLLDDDYLNYTAEDLLMEQVKYNHEVVIGNELAKKYIYPKINK